MVPVSISVLSITLSLKELDHGFWLVLLGWQESAPYQLVIVRYRIYEYTLDALRGITEWLLLIAILAYSQPASSAANGIGRTKLLSEGVLGFR